MQPVVPFADERVGGRSKAAGVGTLPRVTLHLGTHPAFLEALWEQGNDPVTRSMSQIQYLCQQNEALPVLRFSLGGKQK